MIQLKMQMKGLPAMRRGTKAKGIEPQGVDCHLTGGAKAAIDFFIGFATGGARQCYSRTG
jgi:hypothetical protein